MAAFQLRVTFPNGSPTMLSLDTAVVVPVQAGATYQLVDAQTQQVVRDVVLKKDGDQLIVEHQGQAVVRIDGFYSPMQTPAAVDVIGDGQAENFVTQATPAGSDHIVWQAQGKSDGAHSEANGAGLPHGAVLGGIVLGGMLLGEQSSAANPLAVENPLTVEGSIATGPVIGGNGLTVTAYDLNGKVIATGQVHQDGTYSMNVRSYRGPLLVRVVDKNSDADFMDEATQVGVNLGTDLRAFVMADQRNITVNVNPLTEMAVRLAGLKSGESGSSEIVMSDLTADEIAAANETVANAFHLTDVDLLSAKVETTIKANGEPNTANKYGEALAAVSGVGMDKSLDISSTLDTLINGIEGSAFNQSTINMLGKSAGDVLDDPSAFFEQINYNPPAIVGGDVSGSGDEDVAAITGTLAATDTEGLTDGSYFTLSSDGSHGSATIDAATGAWSYTPDANYFGSDSFEVTVTDDLGGTTTQSVSVTVNAVDDAASISGATSGSGDEDVAAITGTLAATDTEGLTDGSYFTLSSDGSHGSASIHAATGAWSYTPDANYFGSDSFDVTVTDDLGGTTTQTVSVTVSAVDDAANISGATSGSGDEDVAPITGTLAATDTEGLTDGSYFTVSANGSHGSASIGAASGAWSYTPDANYFGSDSFEVTVTDDLGGTTTQSVSVTVNAVEDAANISGATSGSGDEDVAAITGTLTATDADGLTDGSYFTLSSDGNHGSASIDAATGAWSYTPEANYFGSDSFDITVTDDLGGTTTQSVSVTVNAVDDAASISGATSGSGDEDVAAITGTLAATDTEGLTDGSYFTLSSDGSHGSASIDAATGAWSYTPEANYFGSDSFDVTVTDDLGGTSTQTVSLTVNPVNDAPVGTAGATVSYKAKSEAQVIDSTITLSDLDNAQMSGAKISISAGRTTGDLLAFTKISNITGSYNSSKGELVLTGDDTVANYQTALRSVTYASTSNEPNKTSATRTISWQVTEANSAGSSEAQSSALVTSTVNVFGIFKVELSGVQAGNGGFAIEGVSADDWVGWSVSGAGDVNGDGFEDVIVGGRYLETTEPSLGATFVVFGKSDGTAIKLSDVVAGTAGGFAIRSDTIFGNVYSSNGASVSSAGDVNGDGLDDLIVGTDADALTKYEAGAAYVVYGQTASTAVELSDVDAGSGGFAIHGPNKYYVRTGYSVSGAGDVNGDGVADLLVGANGHSNKKGAAYVVYGATNASTVELSAVENGDGGFVIYGVSDNDETGCSVSNAGDVNGDGLADLIVGAHADDPNGSASGAAFVVFGKTDGISVQLSAVEQSGSGGFVIRGVSSGDQAGYSVSGAGDINGDGLADLLVGAPSDDPNGNFSGATFVVFGKSDGAVIELSNVDAGAGGFVIEGIMANDRSGRSVSVAGDVNGDGLTDLIIGAPFSYANNTNSGAAYVMYGKTDAAALSLSALDAGQGGFAIRGIGIYDFAGASVSNAGDVNGDGLADLIVGATNDYATTNPALLEKGAAYVIYGQADQGSSVTMGTSGADNMSGTASADQLVAGAGNDTLTGNNSGDVLYGGAGDDTFNLRAANSFMRMDGGTGVDTVALDGSGITLDMTAIANQSAGGLESINSVENIEIIDITGTGNNTLKLAVIDVRDLADMNRINDASTTWLDSGDGGGGTYDLAATESRHQLVVKGDVGDTLTVTDGGWIEKGTLINGGQTYTVFNETGSANQLIVDSDVDVQITDGSIVVFDLVGGTSSSHSNRTFDANVDYTIYIRVDSDTSALKADANSGVGTWGTWSGAQNLSSTDQVILIGDGNTPVGKKNAAVTKVTATNSAITWASASDSTAAILHYTGKLSRFKASLVTQTLDIWSGSFSVFGNFAGNQTLYAANMPVGVLISQGLALA